MRTFKGNVKELPDWLKEQFPGGSRKSLKDFKKLEKLTKKLPVDFDIQMDLPDEDAVPPVNVRILIDITINE